VKVTVIGEVEFADVHTAAETVAIDIETARPDDAIAVATYAVAPTVADTGGVDVNSTD
jgi:bifunctional DNase/RNase